MRGLGAAKWFEFVFWMGIAALAWYFSLDFDREVQMYKFGADGWPRLIILLIACAAVGQVVHNWQEANRADRPEEAPTDSLLDRVLDVGMAPIARMGILLALPIVYAAMLEKMGFYFMTPVFLAGYLFVSGEHRWSRVILIPLVLWGGVTVLFTRYLYLSLPVGYWPGFYDFSNWLVVLLRS